MVDLCSEAATNVPGLRALQPGDMKLMHTWLNEPHLRPFYRQGPDPLESVEAKYLPRLDVASRTACVVASIEDQPFGYMQWYLNRSYPEYGIELLEREFGVSIDYFIGDPRYLNRGLGSMMLVALVNEIEPGLAPEDRVFCIAHADENVRAIRCTTRAGFVRASSLIENGAPITLFVRDATAT